MKLAERPRQYEVLPAEYRKLTDRISSPPIFDIKDATRAVHHVESIEPGRFQSFPALRLALVLSLYNYLTAQHPKESDIPHFLSRFEPLVKQEHDASDADDPRPTIGWEVEITDKSLLTLKAAYGQSLPYKDLFDAFDMYNYNNRLSNDPTWLEFSPTPAYSASVATRLLCELIKGGFIPSLQASKDPEAIRKYLSDKLVSLHINLGVPKGAQRKIDLPDLYISQSFQDVDIFALAFALAFTSHERLASKTVDAIVHFKVGEAEMAETKKSGKEKGRIEIKALEVRGQSVYRLFHEIQLCGATFFATYSDEHPRLAEVWNIMRVDLLYIFEQTQATRNLCFSKTAIADFAQHTTVPDPQNNAAEIPIAFALRRIITKYSHAISKIIQTNS